MYILGAWVYILYCPLWGPAQGKPSREGVYCIYTTYNTSTTLRNFYSCHMLQEQPKPLYHYSFLSTSCYQLFYKNFAITLSWSQHYNWTVILVLHS